MVDGCIMVPMNDAIEEFNLYGSTDCNISAIESGFAR